MKRTPTMRSLRSQLLWSHLILALLMVLVMGGAIWSFVHLGQSIDRVLRNNIRSVIAAQEMNETLERQDSAATFLLAGQKSKALSQYGRNWPLFQKAYDIEAHNITEPGEQDMANDIQRQYAIYRTAIETFLYANPPLSGSDARAYYFNRLEPAFLHLKQRIQDVLDLNQAAIVKANADAKTEAVHASWTGIGVTIGAFLLALLAASRMIHTSLIPLRSLARQAEAIGAGQLNQRIELNRSDEIGALAVSFNGMVEKLRAARWLEEDRLHRAERMSDAALASLYDPVIVTDAQGRVVHLNRAAEGLFGPAELCAGMPIAEAIEDKHITQAVERAIHHERVSAAEDEAGFVPLQLGGAHRVYRLRASPMHDVDSKLLGAVTVLEDVTHLHELDNLKTEFIGVASHELKTPVTSLLLSVQLLEEGAVGPLTTGQREVVLAQKEDLQRLERLMRDLLDITRLEAGVTPPRFEIVSTHELVQSSIAAVASQAEAKAVRLESDAPDGIPGVYADAAQISRVLVNLLNNAVRHTAEGSVRIEAQERNGDVAFTVRDTGVGISPDHLPRIFDRFVQVPGATGGGAGLGLSIAQTIIKAHGSEITVESGQGKGSAFTFSLHTPEHREE